jgi:cephalosporin hydroxylase
MTQHLDLSRPDSDEAALREAIMKSEYLPHTKTVAARRAIHTPRMKIVIDTTAGTLLHLDGAEETILPLFTKEAFEVLSLQWVRVGWSLHYYHNLSWLGHPILQLPEDLLRLQEVVYRIRPKIIIETGVYHGGSLLFHATLMHAMGEGRVIGIDREIPPEVRELIVAHPLGSRISLIEGDSTDPAIVAEAAKAIGSAAPVLVILDSNHARDHVAKELDSYAPFVTKGSYIIATDGIMCELADVPGGLPEWKSDNPLTAASEFAARHPEFRQEQPPWPFHLGPLTGNVTYWPGAWLEKV